jgi:phosphate transport system permease protein
MGTSHRCCQSREGCQEQGRAFFEAAAEEDCKASRNGHPSKPLCSFAIISVLVTVGIIFILSTDSKNFFDDMALYHRNKDVQFTELRLYYDKDGVGMDELDLSYNDVDLNPQRLVLATREPELILDEGDLDMAELKFHYPVDLFLPSNVMGQMTLDMRAIDQFLEEADSVADEMQFDESFREEFVVKRGTYDAALSRFEETYGITLEEAHTGLVEISASKITYFFWGRERSVALLEAAIQHEQPWPTDYAIVIWDFLTGLEWQPMIGKFGILPLLNSTLMTSFIAMLVAAPLGLFVAIYLSEYASEKIRSTLKPILEILAGIPTVVYGYFAVTFMTPLLQGIFGNDVVDFYNTASAGIVMGILILPLVSSMAEDAISAVPLSLRQAAYGLGATKLETSLKVVVPAAISGLSAAFIVGLSRAIGETMIVALAAGAGPNLTANPFEGAETMTGYIVRISSGDVSYQSIDYDSIFGIGLVLFLVTLALNFISRGIVKRFRETYE